VKTPAQESLDGAPYKVKWSRAGQEAVKKLSFRAHNAIADLASVGRLRK
jgi:hypothetical protein